MCDPPGLQVSRRLVKGVVEQSSGVTHYRGGSFKYVGVFVKGDVLHAPEGLTWACNHLYVQTTLVGRLGGAGSRGSWRSEAPVRGRSRCIQAVRLYSGCSQAVFRL